MNDEQAWFVGMLSMCSGMNRVFLHTMAAVREGERKRESSS